MPPDHASEEVVPGPLAPDRAKSSLSRALFAAAFVAEGLCVVALLDPDQWGERLVAPWWGWHVLGISAALTSFRFRFPESYRDHPWLITALVLGFSTPAPFAGLFFQVAFSIHSQRSIPGAAGSPLLLRRTSRADRPAARDGKSPATSLRP